MDGLNMLTLNSHEFHTNLCTERHNLPKGVNEILPHFLRSSTDLKKFGTGEVIKNLLSNTDVAKISAVKAILCKGRRGRPVRTVHVCTCVRMYVCMYVCMYVRITEYMYVRINECMYACMHVPMYLCM